jgi:hypothetical protein
LCINIYTFAEQLLVNENSAPDFGSLLDLLTFDSDSECGCEGGVDIDISDDEYLPGSEHDSDFTDTNLSEHDEERFEALKKEFASLSEPTPFEELSHKKSETQGKAAEANRSLGYNGHSELPIFGQNAKASECELKCEGAKTS